MPEVVLRPKGEKKLPLVLSEQEVSSLIQSLQNIKHKTILSMIYSAGLRVSEAVHLKIEDIDVDRGIIRIEQSKGKKDRIVPLSRRVYEMYNWLRVTDRIWQLHACEKTGKGFIHAIMRVIGSYVQCPAKSFVVLGHPWPR